MTFNDSQQRAIDTEAATVCVLGVPGCGKTRTMVERIRRRVEAGVDPSRIAVMTFTTNGAKEFCERLNPIKLGYAGTLHGWAFGIIQKYGHLIGYRAGFVSIIQPEDHEAMIKSTAKRLGIKPGKATNESRLVHNDVAMQLKTANSVTYDGILFNAHILLCLPAVNKDIDLSEVLIDEAQDSSENDWSIYWALFAALKRSVSSASLFVVGDSDQGIFSFRGAHPEGLNAFASMLTVRTIKLETNYRSDRVICEAATRLIRHNSDRIDKDVIPREGAGYGTIIVDAATTDQNELIEIGHWVRVNSNYSETAIVTRTNAHADQIRDYLTANGIPVATAAAPKLPPDWPRVIAALNVLLDPDNDLHVEKLLRVSGTGDGVIGVLKGRALKTGDSLIHETTYPSTFHGEKTAFRFAGLMWALDISEESKDIVTERAELYPTGTLADLAHDLANPKLWDDIGITDGVHILTGHAAKGREFDCVIVAGCEEEMWCKAKDDEATMQENRRLFFVACTRARHSLILTLAASRENRFTHRMEQRTEVRFLKEMGAA